MNFDEREPIIRVLAEHNELLLKAQDKLIEIKKIELEAQDIVLKMRRERDKHLGYLESPKRSRT